MGASGRGYLCSPLSSAAHSPISELQCLAHSCPQGRHTDPFPARPLPCFLLATVPFNLTLPGPAAALPNRFTVQSRSSLSSNCSSVVVLPSATPWPIDLSGSPLESLVRYSTPNQKQLRAAQSPEQATPTPLGGSKEIRLPIPTRPKGCSLSLTPGHRATPSPSLRATFSSQRPPPGSPFYPLGEQHRPAASCARLPSVPHNSSSREAVLLFRGKSTA
jgi:hypothetical protein